MELIYFSELTHPSISEDPERGSCLDYIPTNVLFNLFFDQLACPVNPLSGFSGQIKFCSIRVFWLMFSPLMYFA